MRISVKRSWLPWGEPTIIVDMTKNVHKKVLFEFEEGTRIKTIKKFELK